MKRIIVALALLFSLGGTAVMAQDTPSIEVPRTVDIRYGNEVFNINPADSGVAIGYVDERNENIEGVTLVIILFVHDGHGWRSAGKIEGPATGDIAGAEVGDVLTLQLLGD